MKNIIYILFSIVLGILYGRYFNSYLLDISLLLCIICCYLVFFKMKTKLKRYNRIYLYCFILIIFSFYTTYRYNKYENILKENNNVQYKCIIISCEKIGDKNNKYIARITQINDRKSNIKVYMYLDNVKQYRYGDIIKCKMTVDKPTGNRNDGGFNNKIFCYSNNIYATCYAKEIAELSNKKDILTYIYNFKEHLTNIINNQFENEAGILISILLGDDKYLTKQEKDIFSNSNLSHVLVVSGTHLAYLLIFSKYIFSRLKFKTSFINILNIFIILFYLVLNNFAISLLRSSIMYIISIVFNMINKYKNNLKIIIELIIVFLIINPFYLFNISVILSFVCVIAIQLLSKKIDGKFQYNLNYKNDTKLKKIIQTFSISICVQIVIVPILSIYFNKIYITSILSSIFAIPISSTIIILGIIYCLTSYIPIVSNIFCSILKILVIILKFIGIYFSNIPLSNITIYPFKWYEIILYYFIFYTLFIHNNLYMHIKIYFYALVTKLKKSNKYKAIAISFIIIIIINSIYSINILEIDFIDVGQGDSICIRVLGKNILIDGGNATDKFDNGKENILPYLLYNRINKLDYIIISHFDSDHINGLIYIINNYRVDYIIFSENINIESDEYINFMNCINLQNVTVKKVKNNDRLFISKKIYIDFYTTDKNTYIYENNSNNNSLVCMLRYFNFKALFVGDAEKEQEKVLIDNNDVKADVIKIGHHGSKSSTTTEFLNTVNPTIAIIQVGKNYYGHPHEEVLTRLQKKGCRIYRNDTNGQISLIVNSFGKIKIKSKLE